MGNKHLPGGQPKKTMSNQKQKNWLPKGQIGKKVSVQHCHMNQSNLNEYTKGTYELQINNEMNEMILAVCKQFKQFHLLPWNFFQAKNATA